MAKLAESFDNLGYDILGLNNVAYSDSSSQMYRGGECESCKPGCTGGCKPGCNNGSKR